MHKLAKYIQTSSTQTPESLQRRGFMITAVSAGFALAFLRTDLSAAAAKPVPPGLAGSMFDASIWFEIDHDGIVTVNITKAEMGQHVGTALARILADELEANWDSVRLNYVDSDPKWGTMVTGGSWSVSQSFEPLSQAGAAGRIALIEEGARLLNSKPADCTARASMVSAKGRSISYGEIVKRGNLTRQFTPEQLKALTLKTPEQHRLVGKETMAIDVPSKTNGTAVYGIDATVDGMVYARPLIPPTRHGSVVNKIDDSAAKKIKGYLQSIVLQDPSETISGWVMVFADSLPPPIEPQN